MLGMLAAGAMQAPTNARAWDAVEQATRPHLPPGNRMLRHGELQRVGQEAIRLLGGR
jgi:hypothetical protein